MCEKSSKKILVSVIIPVYNVEKYIERCLNSVMGQIIDKFCVECILIDDCCTDNSIIIARNILNNYQGPISFTIIKNKCNSGIAASRNVGIKNASGDYLFFMDSDDKIERNCLVVLVNELYNDPSVEVVMGNAYYMKGNRKWINENRIPRGIINNNQLQKLFFLGYIPDSVWNALYKKTMIDNYKLQFDETIVHEDMLWAYCLYQKVDRFVFVPQTTLIYEDNPTSFMNSIHKDRTPHFRSIIYIVKYILKTFSFKHYVDSTMYILRYLISDFDTLRKDNNYKDMIPCFLAVRNEIFKRDLCNLRFFLVLFELQMYYPFYLIGKWSWYRHHFYIVSRILRNVALFFSCVHISYKK